MRNIYVAFLGVVFMVSCSSAVKTTKRYSMRGQEPAQKVTLEVNNTKYREFRKVVQYLKKRGYRLHVVDYYASHVQTMYRPLKAEAKNEQNYLRISATVNEESIQFSGQIRTGTYTDRNINKEGDSPLMHRAWEQLVETAKGYPHERVLVD